MKFDVLTESNFLLYAIKHYDNASAMVGEEEFNDDISRIHSIKRLLLKYNRDGDLKERLILNHLIVLYNMFGEATTRMLVFRIPKELYPALKSFLVFLNRIPEKPIKEIEVLVLVESDKFIAKKLEEI